MAWKVFYSYAHKDEQARKDISEFLNPLVKNGKMVEWYDRKIEPGTDWNKEIVDQLDSANLILFLISPAFLASDYCFGVERERAFARLKLGEVKVAPILLSHCLWKESVFSELQMIPRDAKPLASFSSLNDALREVAEVITGIVSTPLAYPTVTESYNVMALDQQQPDLGFIRTQVRIYAGLYERIRQRMPSSDDRKVRMTQVFQNLRTLATASYPLLDELVKSPSPGEKLAAVAILQVFATETYFPFLVELIRTQKPFVAYQAAEALQFAAGAIHPMHYPQLREAIQESQKALQTAGVKLSTDRLRVLAAADKELEGLIDLLGRPDSF